jgi:hypothetical protein
MPPSGVVCLQSRSRDDLPAVGERVLVGEADPTFVWRLAAIGIVSEVSAEPVYRDEHAVTVELDRLRDAHEESSRAASVSQDPSVVLALRMAGRVEDDGDHGAAEAEAIRDLVRRCRRASG